MFANTIWIFSLGIRIRILARSQWPTVTNKIDCDGSKLYDELRVSQQQPQPPRGNIRKIMQMKSTNPNTPLFLLLLLVLNGSHAFITPSVPKSRPSWSTISGLPKEPMSLLKTYPPAFGGHHRQSPSRLMARGLSYEDLMEKLPSQGVIDAIEKSKDGSVIASGKL